MKLRVELIRELANDLLEAHLLGDIDITTWSSARELVEAFFGPLEELEKP